MREMEPQLDVLFQKIQKMQVQASKSTKMTAIGYLIVVIFVFIYTTGLMSWINKEVTANSLSAQMRNMVDKSVLTDANREKLVKYCKKQAPVWADKLVQITHDQVIPVAKSKVISIIDNATNSGIAVLKHDFSPKVAELIKANAESLNKHKDISDQSVANEVAKILADEAEREMDVFIDSKVKYRIAHLRSQLNELAAIPYKDLTRKQAAKRRLIVNWVFLMEHHEEPANVFRELLQGINGAYKGVLNDFDMAQ